jgi:hypothetical protein
MKGCAGCLTIFAALIVIGAVLSRFSDRPTETVPVEVKGTEVKPVAPAPQPVLSPGEQHEQRLAELKKKREYLRALCLDGGFHLDQPPAVFGPALEDVYANQQIGVLEGRIEDSGTEGSSIRAAVLARASFS